MKLSKVYVRIFLFIAIAFVLLLPLIAQDATSAEAMRQAMYSIAEEITNGNIAALDNYLSADYVLHSPLGDADSAGLKGLLMAFDGAMPDFTFTREQVVIEGNFATTRSMLTGTFESDFVGPMGVLPPTGQAFSLEVINIFRFDDSGLIAEEWAQFDNLSFMTQLGAMGGASESVVVTQEMADHFVERFDAIFDGPQLEIIDEIFTPEWVTHQPLGLLVDRESFHGYVGGYYAAIPDLTQTVNQVHIAGEYIILQVTYTGTHQGELFGIAPTGNAVSFDGIGIFKMNAEGLSVENWATLDILGLLAQVGGFSMPQ